MKTDLGGSTHGGGITDNLEREFQRAYPELAARRHRARPRAAAVAPARCWPLLARAARRWRGALLLACLVLLVWLAPRPASASAGVEPADASAVMAGMLLLEGLALPALLLHTDVDIEVAGVQARVTVSQTFSNTSDVHREGLYTFPLPPGAAIDRLRIAVGERTLRGVVRRRQQARQDYVQAREAGQRAALLQQRRADLFAMAVANIEPGGQVRVEIAYLQRLQPDDGVFELRVPLTLTPRYSPPASGNDAAGRQPAATAAQLPLVPAAASAQRASIAARIVSGTALGELSSRHHPIDTATDATGAWQVTLSETLIPADRDFVLRWSPLPGAAPAGVLLRERQDESTYALLMVHPPAAAAPDYLPREVIFVLDVSGSMGGASLPQAKAALRQGLRDLDAGDYFNVITFSNSARALFPAAVPAHQPTLAHALAYLDTLSAGGGTVMAPALAMAFAGNPPLQTVRQVVFITDGAVANEAELIDLVGADAGAARLFTVAIGSAPNAPLMRELARAGRGAHTFIGDLAQVSTDMRAVLRKLRYPVMSGLQVSWPPGSEADALPARLPDLYAGEPLVLSARLAGASGTVTVSGNLAGLPWSQQLDLAQAPDAPGVATLWARDKIHHLMYAARSPAPAARRARIEALGLRHGLVTPYTSLVAVDDYASRMPTQDYRSTRVAGTLPAGTALLAFPAGASGARGQLLAGLALVLAALFLWRRHWQRPARRRGSAA